MSSYEIEPGLDLPRGTKIVLNLKEDDREFARSHRVEAIIKRYSNFVGFPIELNGNAVNTVQAIWTRSKSEITATEYEEFYKFIGHDLDRAALPAPFQRRRAAGDQRAPLRPREQPRKAGACQRSNRR